MFFLKFFHCNYQGMWNDIVILNNPIVKSFEIGRLQKLEYLLLYLWYTFEHTHKCVRV